MFFKLSVCVLALLAVSVPASAEGELITSPPLSVSLSLGIQEKALKPRFSRVVYDNPVSVTDLTLTFPNGIFVSVIDYAGLDDWDLSSNGADQLEFYVGWKCKVEKLDLKLSVGLVDPYPLDKSAGDLLIFTTAISRTFDVGDCFGKHLIRPEIKVEYVCFADDLSTGAPILMPNVRHTWQKPLGFTELNLYEQVGLEWNGQIGRNSGDGIFFQLSVGLEWKLGNQWKVVPNFTLVSPLTDPHDGRNTDSSLGLNAIFSF